MEKSFDQLKLSSNLLKAVEEMGFTEPTDVQFNAIPHILEHKDLIVRSKTGSGKTAAFGLPILEHVDGSKHDPQALILTPTRELAVQVDLDLRAMSMHSPIKTTAVYGQHNINSEIQELDKGVSIVTGTPGRVFDHIQQKNLKTSKIRYLVLDEADKMLDMGFIDQVVRIIKTLPKDRVTLLFSATMPPEIQKICKAYMKDPVVIEIESDTMTVDTIEQIYYRVDKHDKRTQLERILAVEQPNSCMIFCNTRIAVDKVQDFLMRKGYPAQSLHGAISQSSRLKTIQKFKSGGFQLLVATDVAARGIHVDDLSLVINYDVPLEKDGYVHRIGRTGRAGSGGKAITIVASEDIMSFYDIEEHVGVMISEQELPSEAEVRDKRAEYVGKWANFKIQNPHQERLQEDRHKKPETHKPRENSAKRPTPKAASPTNVAKPQEQRKPYTKPAQSDTRPAKTSTAPVAVKPEAPQKPKVHTPRTQTPNNISQKVVPVPVQTKATGRAYSKEEVAATLERLQAKKQGLLAEKKKGLLGRVKALFTKK